MASIIGNVRAVIGTPYRAVFGPIFDKELRVISRRKRTYVLRCIYVMLMLILVVLAWLTAVDNLGPASDAYSASRMAGAGLSIVTTIVVFQFIMLQLMGVILTSAAISEEIHRRTLGVLMTTPISSFQIVMGKLFGKLLQLLMLLALSVPLLAIVRVFGGVPWRLLIASTCITATAVLFAASVSMFFSIGSRRAYGAFIKTLLCGLFLYLLLPGLFTWMVYKSDVAGDGGAFALALLSTQPFMMMSFELTRAYMPNIGGMPNVSWILHCVIMMVASASVLLLCIVRVRRAALRQITGQGAGKSKGVAPPPLPAQAIGQAGIAQPPPLPPPPRQGRARTVTGSPVVWKELHQRLFRKRSRVIWATIAIVITFLIAYGIAGDTLEDAEIQVVFVTIAFLVAAVVTTQVTATGITSEKEAGTWPILLATPLSNGHILSGKIMGSMRRTAPAWSILAAHVLLFVCLGYIHPVALVQLAITIGSFVFFLSCTGAYFGSRLKSTTGAVMANFGLAVGLWAIAPMLLAMILGLSNTYDDTAEAFVCANPLVQVVVVVMATTRDSMFSGFFGAGGPRGLDYDWPGTGLSTAGETTLMLLGIAVGYCFIGCTFATFAAGNFRRKIF